MPRLVTSPRWTLCLAAGALIALAQCAGDATAELTIGSLPRRERMERRGRSYPNPPNPKARVLGEVACPPASDLFKQASDCDWCVGTLQVECPDCCLKREPPREEWAILCTKEEDPKYACAPLAFPSVRDGLTPACPRLRDCLDPALRCELPLPFPTLDPHCQRTGCPDPEPAGGTMECVEVEDSGAPGGKIWSCLENNLKPTFSGCQPQPDLDISACGTPYYHFPKEFIGSCPELGNKPCYRYKLTKAFFDCVSSCLGYTDEMEDCWARVRCCRQDACPDEPGGYDAHCVTKDDVDGKLFCQKRVESPECDALTPQECQRRWKLAHRCLMDGEMACHECFRQIDESFVLRFVAKSGSELVIFWQMAADPPTGASESEAYFYTMVRVTDDAGKLVHESLVHQKSLEAATTVSASTAVPRIKLSQGQPYQVRLYYFLPPIEKDLQVVVKRIQLLVVETRE